MTSDRSISLVAIGLSLCSLGWQVYDASLKRTERVSWAAAPARADVRIPGKKEVGTSYAYYIVNNGESPVYILEVQPATFFGSQKLPSTGKKIEPGEAHIVYADPVRNTREGLEELKSAAGFAMLDAAPDGIVRIRTTKGEHLFQLDLLARHSGHIEQLEHIRKTQEQFLEYQSKPTRRLPAVRPN